MQGYRRRLRIWETNYGRDAGWTIERNGEPIALLTRPQMIEMFWYSYEMEVVTSDPDLQRRMQTPEFWADFVGLVWRNREFGEVATDAFPAGHPFPEPGRLAMRGLYLYIGEPWLWDRLLLWLRRGSA